MNRFLVFAATASLFALLVTSLLVDNGALDLYRLKGQRDRILQKNAALLRENAGLLRQIDRLQNDPGFLESVARRELGMIGNEDRILTLNRKNPSQKETEPQGGNP